jgi:histidine ammonia-lyase
MKQLDAVILVARIGAKVELSGSVKHKIQVCRGHVDTIVAEQRPVYRITAGAGELCNVLLTSEEAEKLSRNVVMRHACGVGEPLRFDQVKAIIFSAIANFSKDTQELCNIYVDFLWRPIK